VPNGGPWVRDVSFAGSQSTIFENQSPGKLYLYRKVAFSFERPKPMFAVFER